jgi:hypothetical protein
MICCRAVMMLTSSPRVMPADAAADVLLGVASLDSGGYLGLHFAVAALTGAHSMTVTAPALDTSLELCQF